MATYSIAYLCLSDLRLKPPGSDSTLELPRGEFLFVGGDTTYHLADYATLHNRFHTPFIWAYEDLLSLGLVDEARRPIFAIPGNHDYYDMLDGFRRQFRLPFPSRPDDRIYPPGVFGPQLRIPGFERHQETSYVALRLPFEWMFWGLDTEVGKIDERQRDFFKSVNNGKIPNKLIVATCAPTTVFGEFADRDDEKCAKAFLQLDLPRPFLPDDKLEETEKQLQLKPDQIRLDLSGDVHQYARYWGPAPIPEQKTRPRAKAKAISKPNYASVVSGLGGAFHHPSTTYVDEIKEHVLYPPEDKSRSEVTDQIFSAIKVARGGNVWLIGAILAAALAFAAIASESSRPAIHNFGVFTGLHITEPDPYESLIHLEKERQETIQPSVWRKVGIVTEAWVPKVPENPGCENKPMYLWGKCRVEWPREYKWGLGILFLTILPIGAGLGLTSHYYGISKKQQEVKEGAAEPQKEEEKPKEDENKKIVSKINLTLRLSTLLTIILVVVGLLAILPYRVFITPFGNSLLVLATLVWASIAIYLSIRYSDWLFEQAAKRKIRGRDWIITWVLSVAAAASAAIGLWVFGKNNLPAYLVSDIVFMAVVLATFFLLPILAWKLGGEHQKFMGKVGMGLIGFWHWILQLGVALFLIKKGTWLTVILAVVVFLIFKWIGKQLMRANRRWWLLLAWLEFGTIMLALPPVVYFGLLHYGRSLPDWYWFLNEVFYPYEFAKVPTSFASYEWWANYGGWWQLVPLALAAIFGAVLSCMWLGWYFGVCLGFNGHNNEVGGAARIERFKQFIRFRLTENDLTGYVIAVDDPQKEGRLLSPRVIDVFRLVAKKP